MTSSGKRKAQQRQAGFRLLIMVAILVCINMLASRFHYGLDLTSEKRFTLTQSTKNLLRKMDDVAVIDVYLEGKHFPPDFQRMRDAVRERLQALKEYAGPHIVFRFSDPFEGKGDKEMAEVYQRFAQRGMVGIPINQSTDERYTEQIVVPYAIIQYKGKEAPPILLLEGHLGMNRQEQLNYSESMLEYKFASAINQINKPDLPRIAYVMGNGEQLGFHTYDALKTLSKNYHLDTIDINNGTHIPSVYAAAIICKPTIPFDDRQKYKIDQYVMHGGKMLWLLDQVQASMDSFHNSEQFIATDYALNLDDLLFKYGVRVNADLIEDLQCNRIGVMPQNANPNEQGAHLQMFPWSYFPVFVPTSHHPIVNNMDGIMSQFVNSIDLIGNPEIKKTVLLESSQYSRSTMSPARVSLSMLRYRPNPELYKKGFKPTAVLLEGKFQSAFQDRMHPEFLRILRDSLKQPFKATADAAGAMIVISDGDMMLNDVTQSQGPMELGYWRFDKVRYANKSFILNCVEYLTDQSGLLEARSKDVRLRLLDGGRVKSEKTKWQIINIVVPIALVLVFASAYIFFRKRRYEGV